MKKLIPFLLALILLTGCAHRPEITTPSTSPTTTPPPDTTTQSSFAETTAETTGPDQTGESLPTNFTSYTVTDEVAAGMANEVVAQVGDSKLTNGMLQIFYRAEVYNFLNQYGYYLSMFGLDPAKPLDQQPFYADQTISWQQYFLDNAINNWRSYAVLNEIAAAEGYELTQKAKALIPLLVPLFLSAFRRADELAIAMECRCYNGGEGRTRLRQLKFHLRDISALCLGLLLCVGVGILRHFGW